MKTDFKTGEGRIFVPKYEPPCVEITFKMDKGMTEERKQEIIYDIINEIQDRFMYVTEVKLDGEKIFEFDDSKFIIKGGTKE